MVVGDALKDPIRSHLDLEKVASTTRRHVR